VKSLALLVAVAACGKGDAHATAGRDASLVDEQADFDRDRHPDELLAAVALKPGDVVADIGAGTGLLTVHVARAVSPGGRVVATDVDGAVLDLLSTRLRAAGLDCVVERRVVKPDDPGLEPSTYDVILLSQVDNYFDDAAAWLRRAAPALVPGGTIAITNRTFHRAGAMAAADAAGLTLLRENDDVPGQYIAIFTPRADAPGDQVKK